MQRSRHLYNRFMLKRTGKSLLCFVLERQVKRLRSNNDFKIIAVGGSVGKTSTKLAVAKTLSAKKRVIYQDGNYNDRLTVPLVLFGEDQPSIYDFLSWIKLLARTSKASRQEFNYDIAVLEIGTDSPGQMKKFSYLKPDIYLLSSIAEEHMEYFKSINAVANEELEPVEYSKEILINIDDVASIYLKGKTYKGYGFNKLSDYRIISTEQKSLNKQKIQIRFKQSTLELEAPVVGKQGSKIVLAAVATADMAGLTHDDIVEGVKQIEPVAGRMQVLKGIRNSTILDDTYNASPLAVKAALDVLYNADTTQRIAVIGSMNELGEISSRAHEEIGEYCDPTKLDYVVTVGSQAASYLAHSASKKGCKVVSFLNPYEAGDWVKENVKDNAVILAKGSQNGVFAEEALKPLLAKKTDASKLVRQSRYWLSLKKRQFSTILP